MYDELASRIHSYNPNVELDLVRKGLQLAIDSHEGQFRSSGEPYVVHPFHVALILTELNMDVPTIVAGLLHDVIEDTDITYDDVKKEFGEDIADLVDGVTKLKKLKYQSKEEKQAENLRKMVLAMAKDIRVIIVKLADRLHNMRTLEYMTDAKKKEKAIETIEIYAPLAHRLGISKIKWELEDLSLRYMEPEKFYDLVNKVNKRRAEREELIDAIIEELQVNLLKVGIQGEINGRPKNLYSIYKKMHIQGKAFDEIYDLSAIRILVDDIKDCYGALGVVHTLWKPIPGRFKDYIAMPKPNMYQSLHTTVIDSNGEIFEVQIRTHEMHRTAEYGIAAHWKYKQGDTSPNNVEGDNLTWIRQLLEWQKDSNNPTEFMETLKIDFFTDEVFVFTPTGEVISLAEGSTPIDFAYRIHSQVGNTCVGSKVNGRIVPLNYQLKNGNIVEIITNPNSTPSRDWLKIVKTSQAKNKIRQYFKVRDKDKNIEIGQEILEREIKKLKYQPNKLLVDKWLQPIADKYGNSSINDLYAGVGYGNITPNQVIGRLVEKYLEENKPEDLKVEEVKVVKKKKRDDSLGVIIKGVDNIKIRFAKCCTPVPNDPIIGFVTMGRGVSIHRADCPNINQETDRSRFLEVEWDNADNSSYPAEIAIKAIDRGALLADITNRISNSKIPLTGINARSDKDKIANITIVLEIHDSEELERLIERLRSVKGVLEIYRVTS
ncbi:MAG: bifunctional (p)ppGpp synthetase/guanosine-3',5'-bis(diphosphate) 3'-pyrophosphohydrolase [Tissierellia bacterium]|nr:bifunctional (p)ppGpp synthetase/guanosine-3',5'-bis(diphosphate) 3'-pyrophosphohydrolase [Tissierellia bacterium]